MDIYYYDQWRTEFNSLNYKEYFYNSNCVKLCYYSNIHDKRETLFLIHGFSANKHWWDFCLPKLVDQYNVIAVDLCGMGNSDHLKEYHPLEVTRHIYQFLQSFNLKKFHFVSHSFGAYLSSFMLTLHPEIFASFTCIDLDLKAYNPNVDRPNTKRDPIPRRWYASKEIALSRFRLIPKEHVLEDKRWLEHIAVHSICKLGEQWTWCFDPNIFLFHEVPCLKSFSKNIKQKNISCFFIVGENTQLFNINNAIRNWYEIVPPELGQHSIVKNAYHHLMLDQPIEFSNELCSFIQQQAV